MVIHKYLQPKFSSLTEGKSSYITRCIACHNFLGRKDAKKDVFAQG